MMWWLIIAAPAALVAYELLDEDRRAAWVKRWARRRRFGGSVPVLSPEEWHVQVFGTEAPSVEMTREMLAETRPRAALDTSELSDLLTDAKQGLDRRQARRQAGSRTALGCGCAQCVRGTACDNSLLTAMARSRSALTPNPKEPCYTCELLNREAAGPHEHPFEDLLAAERAERGLRPHRVQALWQLVAHARRGTNHPEREANEADPL